MHETARDLGLAEVADDAAQVVSELVTNAMLHGGGCTGLNVTPTDEDGGLRVEVYDASRTPPLVGHPSESSLTGRGLRLVASIASSWGAEVLGEGKVVWAEIVPGKLVDHGALTADDLLAMWGDDDDGLDLEVRHRLELGDVPTDLLLDAKAHVDNVLRELALASAGAQSGVSAAVPAHLTELLAAVDRFAAARVAIKQQAVDAAERGEERTHLVLELAPGAADAAEEYLAALDEIDSYCRARRMLTLESPPQHRAFRRWYVEELVSQLRTLATGRTPEPAETFERRLLHELDKVALAQRASDRAARLFAVAAALAGAATPEAVAQAVLDEGVAALGASGGGLLLATENDTLSLPGAVGYDEAVVARLRSEPRGAELPAAVALRTGEPVWLESRSERDRRFPELAGLEANTISLCAVPLTLQGRQLGALRFSFAEPRLFDEDERRFVMALAAQTAQALDRAQLQHARLDVSRRLQRSLLPPSLPNIPGLEVAALYRPFGDGIEVGGDFYDVWEVTGGWAVALGDVSGAGPEAAAVTALVRHTLRALTLREDEPGRVMALLNRALLDNKGDDSERFCTVILGMIRLDGDDADVLLATGGHPPPVVRRARDGSIEHVALGGGLLGLFDDPGLGSVPVHLHPGDVLVLVTDGVLEARRDGEMFGSEGVEAVLSRSYDAADKVICDLEEAVIDFSGTSSSDDVAAVVLRVRD